MEWEYSKKQNKETLMVWDTVQDVSKSFGKVKNAVGNT